MTRPSNSKKPRAKALGFLLLLALVEVLKNSILKKIFLISTITNVDSDHEPIEWIKNIPGVIQYRAVIPRMLSR